VEKAKAKVFAKKECYKKRLNHATSPKSLVRVINSFLKLSGHTVPLMTASRIIGKEILRQVSLDRTA
jgi:hypothetical protein